MKASIQILVAVKLPYAAAGLHICLCQGCS